MSTPSDNHPGRGEQTVPPDRGHPSDQPKWRKDFPIDWGQDEYVSRRELVKFMVLTSFAFAVGQGWLVWKNVFRRDTKPPALPVARVDQLAVGGAMTFTYPPGSTPRLLVRTAERDFVAYDQQCTHLLCPIVPEVREGKLHCPCHNGWFELETGRVLAGPPRRGLPRVLLEVRGNTVYATGIEYPDA